MLDVEQPAVRNAEGSTLPLPLALATLAILFSIGNFAWLNYHDPFSGHLEEYDFSNPSAALLSSLKMEAEGDVFSQLELARAFNKSSVEEYLSTFQVQRQSDWKGKRLLFVSYTLNWMPKHEVAALEKDTSTGWWRLSYVSPHDVEKENASLARMMKNWDEHGRFEP
jgi:hypothetical protein